jgi:tetratricopeptide (TPR) repeat protein
VKSFIYFLLFSLALVQAPLAQTGNSTKFDIVYHKIMSLRLDEASAILARAEDSLPANAQIAYLENYIDFLKVFISEDENIFETAEDDLPLRKEIIQNLSPESPFRNYYLANMNLQWAFARLKFNEYFTAAIEINRAYRLIEENTQTFPAFYPNKITFGVLKIMLGLIPEKYNWILNLVSMEGSVEEGTKLLYQVLEKSKSNSDYPHLREESLFYLGFIELSINPDKNKSLLLLEEMLPLAQDSPLFSYLCINILSKTGQNDSAFRMFDTMPVGDGYFPFYYLDYLHAELYLKSLQTNKAAKYYSKFLKNFKGKNYIKDAWRKTAWTYLLEGKTEGYKHILSNVATHGNTDIGVDKNALSEYKSGAIPNIGLLKGRLLFDGHYYSRADSILNGTDKSKLNFQQQIEITYRFARIKHATDSIAQAKVLYKKVVMQSVLTTNYFPANSALKLGEIYESEDSNGMAFYYYQKCRQMEFDQFENSIKAKAKEGMRRVEE